MARADWHFKAFSSSNVAATYKSMLHYGALALYGFRRLGVGTYSRDSVVGI